MLAWLAEFRNSADILVLDWSLPEKPGIELLAELRAALPGVTITVSELRTDPWDFAIV